MYDADWVFGLEDGRSEHQERMDKKYPPGSAVRKHHLLYLQSVERRIDPSLEAITPDNAERYLKQRSDEELIAVLQGQIVEPIPTLRDLMEVGMSTEGGWNWEIPKNFVRVFTYGWIMLYAEMILPELGRLYWKAYGRKRYLRRNHG